MNSGASLPPPPAQFVFEWGRPDAALSHRGVIHIKRSFNTFSLIKECFEWYSGQYSDARNCRSRLDVKQAYAMVPTALMDSVKK